MTNTERFVRSQMGKDKELEMRGKCHDCEKDLSISVRLTDDDVLEIDHPFWYMFDLDKCFAKCNECYEIEPMLKNFQPCEVFSRVCGYVRPVKQYNPGKQAEKAMRVDYKIDEKTLA